MDGSPAIDPVTEAATPQVTPTPPEGVLQRLGKYYQSLVLSVGVFAFLFINQVGNVSAQIVNLDGEAITEGFFDGFNLILGLTGLMALMALPYGIQFAFNFISSIFSKFSSVRF